jgi:hypothetical protein
MLMVAILTWEKDLVFQKVRSVQAVHDLKRRLALDDTDFIIHDSAFLCPIKLDCATRELDEDEQLEWLMTEAYPQLVAEGRMVRDNHGKYVSVAKNIERKEAQTKKVIR